MDDLMPLEEWERNRYASTVNTPTAVHEMTTRWLTPIEGGSPTYQPKGATPSASSPDLTARALALAAAHDLTAPSSIDWGQLNVAWGFCDLRTKHVTINAEAALFPQWVVDGIIVHELAHFTAPGHGDQFKALINRYPLAREADGYLACVQERDWDIHVTPHQHQP